VFGFVENSMHGSIIRTIGIARAKAKIGMIELNVQYLPLYSNESPRRKRTGYLDGFFYFLFRRERRGINP